MDPTAARAPQRAAAADSGGTTPAALPSAAEIARELAAHLQTLREPNRAALKAAKAVPEGLRSSLTDIQRKLYLITGSVQLGLILVGLIVFIAGHLAIWAWPKLGDFALGSGVTVAVVLAAIQKIIAGLCCSYNLSSADDSAVPTPDPDPNAAATPPGPPAL